MKKVYLSFIGFALVCRMHGYAQLRNTSKDTVGERPMASLFTPEAIDSSGYSIHRLRIDEINLVSSYYNQDGNHSAVTGGIGTEKVTDISNGIDLKLVWLGNNNNKNTISAGLGIDYHTSASAAYVNLSGASKTGGSRIYPSLDWTIEKAKTGNTFGIGTYLSTEYNYNSFGADIHFSRKTRNKNGEFSLKLQAYLDNVTLIYPSEFVPKTTTVVSGVTVVTSASGRTSTSGGGSSSSESSIPTSPRNTYTASTSYSQMINTRLQVMFLADFVKQDGYLSLPFHRVYFSSGKDTIEHLPSSRFKLPLGVRLNYFMGDNIIIRSYYRYYFDDWGTKSNTANLEVAYKITPFLSLSPFYRYYTQSAAKYFAPYEGHSATDQYYTSNYAYAKFNSNFFGMGFRAAPPKGVLGLQGLHDLEVRYGHYSQSTSLASNVISMSLGFK
ncbi:uncharacterized protein DUF3570 [Mucilaginibacter gracilis]|uniref:Uncharacterized protein DUF3570 n=1 Tax=Mucilaginibacter gracilis TaxID=423350 RepID=A0A495J7X5_9SPHI|nr:DUF3570 domain-containing protein [Mucilaginibacter gracilis]RKR84853.1 uncharacterized protein DUF3570 [Mucilaginibacter gracilis]